MKYKKLWIIFLLFSILLLGCKSSESTHIQSENTLLKELKEVEHIVEQQVKEIERLEEQLYEANKLVSIDTKELINELQLTIEEKEEKLRIIQQDYDRLLQLTRGNETVNNMINEQPWLGQLNNSDWDRIKIYRYPGDTDIVTITDTSFLKSNNIFKIRSVNSVSYPGGYRTYTRYIYEFRKNENVYIVEVVDRGVIKAGEQARYYEVDNDVHLLGNAFMSKPTYIQHDGLIAKIADSGMVKQHSTEIFTINEFRVKSIIVPIADSGKQIKQKPNNLGKKVDSFTFYYYGKTLEMDVYNHHVHLKGIGIEEWYELKDSGEIITATVKAG